MSGIDSLKYNEYTKDLVVYDDEYLEGSTLYEQIGENLNLLIEAYISVMKECASQNQGLFASNLDHFSSTVEQLLKKSIKGICDGLKNDMNDYIAQLDNADGSWN